MQVVISATQIGWQSYWLCSAIISRGRLPKMGDNYEHRVTPFLATENVETYGQTASVGQSGGGKVKIKKEKIKKNPHHSPLPTKAPPLEGPRNIDIVLNMKVHGGFKALMAKYFEDMRLADKSVSASSAAETIVREQKEILRKSGGEFLRKLPDGTYLKVTNDDHFVCDKITKVIYGMRDKTGKARKSITLSASDDNYMSIIAESRSLRRTWRGGAG